MAIEHRLALTASQVDDRLNKVETNATDIKAHKETLKKHSTSIENNTNEIEKNAANISNIIKDVDIFKENGANEDIAGAIVSLVQDSFLNIEDSAVRGFKGLSICGNSFQNAYIGKNLFDKDAPIENIGNGFYGVKIFVGENTTVTASIAKKYSAGERGGYLRLSADGALTNDTANIWLYHNESNGDCKQSATFISTDGYISIIFTTGAYEFFKDELQVEIGEVKTSYEPYVGGEPSPSITFPQEVTHIAAGEEIDVFVREKNLFGCYIVTAQDLKLINTISYNAHTKIDNVEYDGDIKVTFTGTPDATGNTYKYQNGYFSVGLNGLEVGRTYTLIYDFEILKNPLNVYEQYCLINEANVFYTMVVKNKRAKCTFTLKEHHSNPELTAIEFRPCARDMIYKNFMILAGERDFEEYTPTQTQQITITAPEIGIPGFDNFYDEIDLEKGKYIQRIGKYEFTGEGHYDDYTKDHFAITHKIEHLHESPLLCSHSPIGDKSTIWANENYIRFDINYWNVSTVDEFKAFLAEKYAAGNPVYICYVLPEPIETDLTEELIQEYKKLYTNYPVTTVANNRKCKMKVNYVADTKNYIDNRIKYEVAYMHEKLNSQIATLELLSIKQAEYEAKLKELETII